MNLRKIRFWGVSRARDERVPLREPTLKEKHDLALQRSLAFSFSRNTEPGVDTRRREGLVVSLTSYGTRVRDVHVVLESLFQQVEKAKRIVLWLDEAEYQPTSIPLSLRQAQRRGLEIRFCRNIRSYKKIIPSLVLYPDDVIVTVDDDVMYPDDFLSRLEAAHDQQAACVIAYRAHRMRIEGATLKPYLSWQKCVEDVEPAFDIFPTGAGGVLYPPRCFAEEVGREDLFMSLCPTADDVWLKAMTLKVGIRSWVVPGVHAWSELPPFIADTQEDCLAKENVRSGNDLQIKRVFDRFSLWPRLYSVQRQSSRPSEPCRRHPGVEHQ